MKGVKIWIKKKLESLLVSYVKVKKITQQELAEKIGVTDRAISNWENGRRLPDYSILKSLCKELDVTINELLSGKKLEKEEYQEKLEGKDYNLLLIIIFYNLLLIIIFFDYKNFS